MQTRCEEVGALLLEAAALSVNNERLPNRHGNEDEHLNDLMKRRRTLEIGTVEKTQISKEIQKQKLLCIVPKEKISLLVQTSKKNQENYQN